MKLSNYWKQAGIPETSKFFDCKKEDLRGDDKYLKMVENIFKWDFKEPAILSILSEWNGCGKTHIAVSLLKKHIYGKTQIFKQIEGTAYDIEEHERDFENSFSKIKFKKEYDIYYEILASYRQNSFQSEESIINDYCDLDFLVIDDMFSSKENEFARRVILTIIDKRVDC